MTMDTSSEKAPENGDIPRLIGALIKCAEEIDADPQSTTYAAGWFCQIVLLSTATDLNAVAAARAEARGRADACTYFAAQQKSSEQIASVDPASNSRHNS